MPQNHKTNIISINLLSIRSMRCCPNIAFSWKFSRRREMTSSFLPPPFKNNLFPPLLNMPFSSRVFHHWLCHRSFPLCFFMAAPKKNYCTVRYHGNDKTCAYHFVPNPRISYKNMCWSKATHIGTFAVSPPPPPLIWTFIKPLTSRSKGETDTPPFGAVNHVVYQNRRG